MKSYYIFLDDLRNVTDVFKPNKTYSIDVNEFILCRTVEEAVSLIEEKGKLPSFISFDNDLGIDEDGNLLKDGLDFAKWIKESLLDGDYTLPEDFRFNVHSANPVASMEIKSLMDNIIKFLN